MYENHPILVGEDDENDSIILERALRRVGFANPIQFCRDGTEVIKYLSRQEPYHDSQASPFPRMLITDLKMPKMGGLEVLQWLYHHPDLDLIPKIVLTASRQANDVQQAYRWGANSYLVKPGGYESLTTMLRLFFEYWEMCEKPPIPKTKEILPPSAVETK